MFKLLSQKRQQYLVFSHRNNFQKCAPLYYYKSEVYDLKLVFSTFLQNLSNRYVIVIHNGAMRKIKLCVLYFRSFCLKRKCQLGAIFYIFNKYNYFHKKKKRKTLNQVFNYNFISRQVHTINKCLNEAFDEAEKGVQKGEQMGIHMKSFALNFISKFIFYGFLGGDINKEKINGQNPADILSTMIDCGMEQFHDVVSMMFGPKFLIKIVLIKKMGINMMKLLNSFKTSFIAGIQNTLSLTLWLIFCMYKCGEVGNKPKGQVDEKIEGLEIGYENIKNMHRSKLYKTKV